MFKHLLQWFTRRSMRAKLTLVFSTTIIAFLLLAMILLGDAISSRQYDRFVFTATKSYDQANLILQKYLDSIRSASNLISNNGELQTILTSEEFTGNRIEAIQYREFLSLNKIFDTAELDETIYMTRVFVPDELFYSNNIRHFAPLSQLQDRPDYQAFREQTKSTTAYYSMPEDVLLPGNQHAVSVVSLLRIIKTTDGTERELCVAQISMETSDLKKVLEQANVTDSGMVYLMNPGNQLITYSLGKNLTENEKISPHALPEYLLNKDWQEFSADGHEYLMLRKRLPDSDWMLVSFISKAEIYKQTQEIIQIIFLLTVAGVFVTCLASFLFSKMYTKRLDKLVEVMGTVQSGDLDAQFKDNSNDEIGKLSQAFQYMMHELKNLMAQQYRSGKAVKSAQLKALQAQINPHFLYNTLDLINWEAMDHNAPEIADVAQSLAQFYRISLNKGRQLVTVEEEIKLVQAYVNIENKHFEGAISLDIAIPAEIMKCTCINIILQPLVENAIMHSLAKDPSMQEISISIHAQMQEGDILFSIIDDGKGMTQAQIDSILETEHAGAGTNGYGVKNIDARIKLRYGEEYGLVYHSIPGQGTTVFMRIPAILGNDIGIQEF